MLNASIEGFATRGFSGTNVNLVRHARENGELPENTNERILAFSIDNLLVMFQFSFSSDYYKQRLRLYVGERGFDGDRLIEAIEIKKRL